MILSDRPNRVPAAFERTMEAVLNGQPYDSWYDVDSFVHCGISSGRDLDVLREWIGSSIEGRRANSVFMDTTTLHTVQLLLHAEDKPGMLTPATLLDLDTFIRCVVLYDHVFHFASPLVDSFDFNEALGNEPIFIPLNIVDFDDATRLSGVMDSLFGEVSGHLRMLLTDALKHEQHPGLMSAAAEEAEALREGWAKILGMRPEIGHLIDCNEKRKWSSDPVELVHRLLSLYNEPDVSLYATVPDQWRDFISESNHRSLFNSRVSDLLELPYACNVARLPFRRHYYLQAKLVQERLSSLRVIEQLLKERAETYLVPDKANLTLPAMLAVVVGRTERVSHILESLAQLRYDARALRQHRLELEDALQAGPRTRASTIRRLRAAIQTDLGALRSGWGAAAVEAICAVVGAAMSGPPWGILTGLALLTVAAGLSEQQRYALIGRFLKPREWFLTNMAQTVDSMSDALPQIESLWRLPDGQRNAFRNGWSRIEALRLA